ncbi:MAG: hypothetical protein V4631_20975 [Pseudomonadota bacterium]
MSRLPPVAKESPQDLVQKHNRVLLHALQTAHPVMHKGKSCFIHTLTFQTLGGGIDTTVYMSGDPAPIRAAEVQLQENPQ